MIRVLIGLAILFFTSNVFAQTAPPAPPAPQGFVSLGGDIPDAEGSCEAPFTNDLVLEFEVRDLQLVSLTASVNPFIIISGFEHTWVGDLTVKLIAPDNTEHIIFSRVGLTDASSLGDSSELSPDPESPYLFEDATDLNFWTAARIIDGTTPIPGGPAVTYPTHAAGSSNILGGQTAPITSMNMAFENVRNPNGTWKLCFADEAGGDVGSVVQAQLFLNNLVPAEPLCLPIVTQNGTTVLICL